MDGSGSGFNINMWVGNGASLGAIIISFAGYIPALAAGVALVWYLIQIFESPTVQRWLRSRRTRQIARMKAQAAKLTAQALIMEAKTRGQLPGPGEDPDEA